MLIMKQNNRLATTYYRNFILFIVFPLIVLTGILLEFIHRYTIEAANSRIELAQNNIIAALRQDIDSAALLFNHFLLINNRSSLSLASRIVTTSGQENYNAVVALQELFRFLLTPTSSTIAVHFYAKNGTYFYLKDALAMTVEDVRGMQFYKDALAFPDHTSVSFVPAAITFQGSFRANESPIIAIAFAPVHSDPTGHIEMACLYISTHANTMLQNFSQDANHGKLYLLDKYGGVILSPKDMIGEPNIPDDIRLASTGTYSANLETGRYSYTVQEIAGTDWKLVSAVSTKSLLQDFTRLSMIVIVISVMLLVFYYIFSSSFLRNIVKPLNSLIFGMRKLESGDMQANIEPSGEHEIRSLIHSFNDMVVRIDDLMRINEGIFKAAPVGLVMFDDEYKFIDCNETVLKMLDVTKDYYLNNFYDFFPEYQPDGSKSIDKALENMKRALNGELVVMEWMYNSPDGEPIPCEVTLTRTKHSDKFIGLGFLYDLRNIRNMEQNIKWLKSEVDKIYYDALTGIYNRRYFDKQLDHVIKSLSRARGDLSLLMIDIDYFKKYNDTYGHSQGDTCLKIVAETLKGTITRVDDFVARYGGEEFVVVLPNTNESGARAVAAALLEGVRKHAIVHENSDVADYVTISIGAATGRVEYTQSGDDYIKQADEMLYQSKQNGRDRYSFCLMPSTTAMKGDNFNL